MIGLIIAKHFHSVSDLTDVSNPVKAKSKPQQPNFRAALIGLGAGAERIMLPALTRQREVRLVAACERDATTRSRVGKRWQISQIYEDPATMLATEQPDIVAIATPPFTHYELCLLALKHGCHVFCEKPFMPSLEKADEIIDLACQNHRLLGVNSQYYQMPIYQQVQKMLVRAEVGRLFYIDAWQHMYLLPHEEGGWKAALQPRRVLFEFGTHIIDLMCRFFNAYPQAVTARIARVRPDIDADVCISVRLDFPEERSANIQFNRMSYAPLRYFEMRLDCEKAAIRTSLGGVAGLELGWNSELRRPRLRFSLTKGGEARLERGGASRLLVKQPASVFGDAATAHFSQFVADLKQGKQPETFIRHDRQVLRVMLACYQSADQGGELIKL